MIRLVQKTKIAVMAARLAEMRGVKAPTNSGETLFKMTCPHCQTQLDFDTTPEKVTTIDGKSASVTPVRNTRLRQYRAELFTLTCPECGGQFDYDTGKQEVTSVGVGPDGVTNKAASLAARRSTKAPHVNTSQSATRVIAVAKGGYSSARANANRSSLAERRKKGC